MGGKGWIGGDGRDLAQPLRGRVRHRGELAETPMGRVKFSSSLCSTVSRPSATSLPRTRGTGRIRAHPAPVGSEVRGLEAAGFLASGPVVSPSGDGKWCMLPVYRGGAL